LLKFLGLGGAMDPPKLYRAMLLRINFVGLKFLWYILI